MKNENRKGLVFERKGLSELQKCDAVKIDGGDITMAIGPITERLKEIEKYRYTQK